MLSLLALAFTLSAATPPLKKPHHLPPPCLKCFRKPPVKQTRPRRHPPLHGEILHLPSSSVQVYLKVAG